MSIVFLVPDFVCLVDTAKIRRRPLFQCERGPRQFLFRGLLWTKREEDNWDMEGEPGLRNASEVDDRWWEVWQRNDFGEVGADILE